MYFGGLYNEAGPPCCDNCGIRASKVTFVSGDGSLDPAIVAAAGGPQFIEGSYMTSVRREAAISPPAKVVVKR